MPSARRFSVEECRHLFDYDPITGHVTLTGRCYPKMWRLIPKMAGQRIGSIGNGGYRYVELTIDKVRVRDFEHHVIWRLVHGCVPPECTDHVNRDRADNRLENLRAATRSDNARNRARIYRKTANSPCRYKGIYFDKSYGTKKYRAVIYVKKKRIDLGRYATEDEALVAYKAAALTLHGQFASWE